KGFDTFVTTHYEEAVKWLKEAIESGGYETVHMPAHVAADSFPMFEPTDTILFNDFVKLLGIKRKPNRK
ncbi:glutamine amidotransferase, partial [Clostridioides difficile]|uniref:glutamine amidotransferase n=1 Tax=Clostridioides difficile TaxID=1496 RepID=UPI003F8D3B81